MRRLILSLSTADRSALARQSRGTGIVLPSCSLCKTSLYLKPRSRLADFACLPNSPSLVLRRCSLRTENRLCPPPNLRVYSSDRKTLSWVMGRHNNANKAVGIPFIGVFFAPGRFAASLPIARPGAILPAPHQCCCKIFVNLPLCRCGLPSALQALEGRTTKQSCHSEVLLF